MLLTSFNEISIQILFIQNADGINVYSINAGDNCGIQCQ
jgi:hypothetical protein